MIARPRFGVAGNPPNFKHAPEKGQTTLVPQWLASIGLDGYEYEAVRGVTMTEERAHELGACAAAHRIFLSVHAPYYTNFLSLDDDLIASSTRHLGETVRIAAAMGARVIVLHPGWYKGHPDSASALDRCRATLGAALETLAAIDERVLIAPETCGLKAQFGSLDEILALCAIHPRLVPCLDFAHMHARLGGHVFDDAAFDDVFTRVEHALGREKLEQTHIHYYPVEYADKGEQCHHAFDEPEFGPRPEPFVAALRRWKLTPTVVCESKDRQDLDALLMKRLYEEVESKKAKVESKKWP